MTNSANIILDQALELSATERAIVAEKLLFSLDNADSKIDDLWAKEADSRVEAYKKGGIEAVNNALKDTGSAVHKIIDTHPVSGLKYINVNQSFTRHIVGMIQGESDRILHYLYQHMAKPEFQVRFRWRNNSIAVWDNRITHHYAVCDYLPNIRHMQRITVLNDKRVV